MEIVEHISILPRRELSWYKKIISWKKTFVFIQKKYLFEFETVEKNKNNSIKNYKKTNLYNLELLNAPKLLLILGVPEHVVIHKLCSQCTNVLSTVCPRSSKPFYISIYYIKGVTSYLLDIQYRFCSLSI